MPRITAPAPELYASLTGPLLGLYFPLPRFLNPMSARVALNTSKLKGLWCSVYTREEVGRQIKQFGGLMLDDGYARLLDFDSHALRAEGFTDDSPDSLEIREIDLDDETRG